MVCDAVARDPAPGLRCVLVRSGGTRYALPAQSVRQVIRVPSLYPVPGSGLELLGLTRHGGEPLAVLDIDVLTTSGGSAGSGRDVVVVVSAGGELALGLAVDEAEQVVTLRCSLPPTGSAGFVLGKVGDGEDAIQLLDPGWLLLGEDDSGETPD